MRTLAVFKRTPTRSRGACATSKRWCNIRCPICDFDAYCRMKKELRGMLDQFDELLRARVAC
ncbi:MAG TPA: hypothetical protein VEQ87_19900 [Burkholderiales bacterium]|nr:hypothetical protein [Burkholderiales bacterium]